MRVEKRGLQLIRICLLPPTPRHLGGHLTGSVARRSTFFIFRIPLMVPMVRLELTHPSGYQILSLGCLPIPSQRHINRSMFATSDSGPLLFQLAVSVKRGQRCFEVLTAAMSASRVTSNLLVAKAGLEPARPQRHLILSQARLPIPSLGHMAVF